MKEIGLHFGAMCDPINDQLEKQGLRFKDPTAAERFEKMVQCVIGLLLQGILTDGEKHRAYRRIMIRIRDAVVEIPGNGGVTDESLKN